MEKTSKSEYQEAHWGDANNRINTSLQQMSPGQEMPFHFHAVCTRFDEHTIWNIFNFSFEIFSPQSNYKYASYLHWPTIPTFDWEQKVLAFGNPKNDVYRLYCLYNDLWALHLKHHFSCSWQGLCGCWCFSWIALSLVVILRCAWPLWDFSFRS